MNALSTKSGQTLIEVLIAFAVTVIIGVGLITVAISTQRASVSARNEAQGTSLAQDYVEKLRVLRDTRGWNGFVLGMTNTTYVLNVPPATQYDVATWSLASSWTVTAPCNQAAPSVMRGEKITVSNVDYCRKLVVSGFAVGGTKATFSVEVGWMEGDKVRSTRAESVLSKWCSAVITAGSPVACPL